MDPEQNKTQQRLRPLVLKTLDQESPYIMARDFLRYQKLRSMAENFPAYGSTAEAFDQKLDELILADP